MKRTDNSSWIMSEHVQVKVVRKQRSKNETGVAKNRVRNLVRGVAGIDPRKLDAGVVCWNPPEQVDNSLSGGTM